MLLQPVMMTMT